MAALVLLGACSSTGNAGTSPSPTSIQATPTPQVSSGRSPSAGVPTPSPTGATPSSTSTVAGGCSTSDLAVVLGPANGTAGAIYYPVQFTNQGASSCTLYGFPGVSFVAGSDQHQVGAAATRTQQAPSTITINAGSTASSLLKVNDSGAFECTRVPVSGLRVFPPGDTASVVLTYSGMACTNDVQQLTVGPVVSGSSGQ